MAKSEIRFDGEVIEAKPSAMFDVELENGSIIIARIAGKLRINYIRITPGDWVTVEMSPYDLTKGRIIKRLSESDSKRMSKDKRNRLREIEKNRKKENIEITQNNES